MEKTTKLITGMSWTDYPDKIYVINLYDRVDRYEHVVKEFDKYGIKGSRFPVIKNKDGRRGIAEALTLLFEYENKVDRLLVFEDDVQFLENPNIYMPVIIEQLKNIDYDLFYLGVNTTKDIMEKTSENILPLQTAYALHAVLWSRSGMDKFLSMPMELPIDVAVNDHIVSQGFSYCAFPMLCTQVPSYSDIERQQVDYSVFLEKRFADKTRMIR